MKTALYLLLPDRREERIDVTTRIEVAAYNVASSDNWQPYFRPVTALSGPRAWVSRGPIAPDDMLALLRRIDWAYPAKLLYRTESEDTWSFVTLGLSLRPALPEGAEWEAMLPPSGGGEVG